MKTKKAYKILSLLLLPAFAFIMSGCKKTKAYTISWINEDGSVLEVDNDVKKGVIPTYDGTTPTKADTQQYTYTFSGWSPSIKAVTEDTTYTATFNSVTKEYNVKFVNYDGTVLKDKKYEYGTEASNIELPADPLKSDDRTYTYTFNGWDSEISAVTKDVTYTATYTETYIDYTISFIDEDGETVLQTGTYHHNDEVIPPVISSEKQYLYNYSWSSNVTECDGNATYQLVYDRTSLYFGYYPQTHVTDNELIESLNELDLPLPVTGDSKGWTDYEYYYSEKKKSFMWYIDIDLDNDNRFDYRGVYFTGYRPINVYSDTSESSSRQDDNKYYINTVYWFKYEPVKWNIYTEKDNKAMIISSLMLDSQSYEPVYFEENQYEHNGGIGYANNYELSYIRKWLNDQFYNTAFNELEKAIIEETKVDNSEESTNVFGYSNGYVCDDTNDNMFLLSYKEAYYSPVSNKTTGTDYAKSQGLYINNDGESMSRLRSPNSLTSRSISYVYYDGGLTNSYYPDSTIMGIRPVCWIKL